MERPLGTPTSRSSAIRFLPFFYVANDTATRDFSFHAQSSLNHPLVFKEHPEGFMYFNTTNAHVNIYVKIYVMDAELRLLYLEWVDSPNMYNLYKLLNTNRRATGSLIRQSVLDIFAKANLIPVFLEAINEVHNYVNLLGHAQDVDEFDIFENLSYSVELIDNLLATDLHQMPSDEDKPVTLLITLKLHDDVESEVNNYWIPQSVAIGNVDNNQNRVSQKTFELLRRMLRKRYGYDWEYSNDIAWGYDGVLPIGQAGFGKNRGDLILIYTFYPDIHLWKILIDREFS